MMKRREHLLIVDEQDRIIRHDTKEACHAGHGIRHRAITIFIMNDRNEILLTKRSAFKKLWPGYWDTSCSTHVLQGETYEQAGERRLPEELGFSCKLTLLCKFQYKAHFEHIGSENEMCALLLGHYSGDPHPNPKEISDYRWRPKEQLEKEIETAKEFSPWLTIALKEYFSSPAAYPPHTTL